jgi:hypothetical protein
VISDQSISGFSDQGSECRHQRLALDGAHWQSMPSNEWTAFRAMQTGPHRQSSLASSGRR